MDLGAQPEMFLLLLQGASAIMLTSKTVKMLPKSSPESSKTVRFPKYFTRFIRNGYHFIIPKLILFCTFNRIATLAKDGGRKYFRSATVLEVSCWIQFFFQLLKDTTVHAWPADDLSVLVGWTGDNHRLDTSICVLFLHEQSECGCPSFPGSCRS